MTQTSSVNALMRAAIAEYDWARTPLGHPETWPQSLTTVLSLVLDTPFSMLIMWGPELIQLYNDGYVPIFGDKHPRSLGEPAKVSWADIWDDVGGLLMGVYERGEAVFFENLPLMMQRHGGHEQAYFTFSYSPIREKDVIRGIICVVNETTAHVLRERETQERAQSLAELDRAKTQFFNNVSHEFRTPLTLILSPLEDLAKQLPEYEHRQSIELVQRNALRLQKLVNTLLDFSLAQSGRAERNAVPLNVGVLTADLASEFRSAFDRSGLYLDVNADPRLVVPLDHVMYEKIVLNLLSNALKFTFEGGVTVNARRVGETFVLEVADTGTGIPGNELPHLFERFRRVHGARSRTHEGSGIGLALVHELVTLHHGTISVASTPGAGTTFTVTFPIAAGGVAGGTLQKADTHMLRRSFRVEAQSLVEAVGEGRPAAALPDVARISIADDNADLRAYLARLLRPHYNVEVAANGAELLDKIDPDYPPDLVILDLMMPEMDGFECARKLRADPRTAAVCVLFLSARAGDESVSDGLFEGDEYVVKPFVAADLLARIAKLLRLRRDRRKQDDERLDITRERFEHSLMAAAADAFIAAIDTRGVAEAVTSILVPTFSDWAMLYVPREGGTLDALSVRHRSSAKTELGILVESRYPYRLSDASAQAQAFATGEPVFVPEVDAALIATLARDAEHEAILSSLGLRSAMFVPVIAGDTVVAVLAIVRAENPMAFDDSDLQFAVRFAARTALALESSRTYERDRTIAVTLQRALLPGTLPDVHGLRLSASYAPASNESLIGGDWYDAFVLPDGRVLLSIGDVVGHGLGAATTMASLRQGLRVLADRSSGPADLLLALNALLTAQEAGRLATAVVVEIDPISLRATAANAGHPYPLIVRSDGSVDALRIDGLMLGVETHPTFAEVCFQLKPNEELALYTDGYTENERDALAGEQRLMLALARAHTLLDPAPQVHVDVLGSQAPTDDAALLIVSVLGDASNLYLRAPATPEAVASARPVVRKFLARSGLDATRQFEMLVAVGEAVINVVEHAYEDEKGDLVIQGTHEGEHVTIEIEDFGKWSERRGNGEQRGYGLPLMHAFAGIVSIERTEGGSRVRLTSRLDANAGEIV